MNLADCTVTDGQADLGGVRLPLPANLGGTQPAGTKWTVGLRPESIGLQAASADALRVPAQVLLLEPLGSETLVTLKIGQAEWVARWPASFKAAPGHSLDVFFPPSALRLFEADTGQAVPA